METKKCTKCGEEKLLSAYSKQVKSKDGLKHHCKQCIAVESKRYRDENKEKIALSRKEWAKRNKELLSEKHKEYYRTNRDSILTRVKSYTNNNKKAVLHRQKTWRQSNKDRSNYHNARRRAIKNQATPLWADTSAVSDFYTMAKAFNLYTGNEYHVDHIVPLNSKTVCGLHCESNLQILLSTDNHIKGNRQWPDMWT